MFGKPDMTAARWICQPRQYTLGDRVEIVTQPGTDLWQNTYYNFVHDNAPGLLWQVEEPYFSFVVRTDFQDSHQRFDQCGILLYQTSESWLKASIEYENSQFQRLGSVVTNRGYSDWATTDIPASQKFMYYRLSRREEDFCVEHSLDGKEFHQMRIAHLEGATGPVSVGIYACSPEESSFRAVFSQMEFLPCQWQAHA